MYGILSGGFKIRVFSLCVLGFKVSPCSTQLHFAMFTCFACCVYYFVSTFNSRYFIDLDSPYLAL